MVNILKYYCDCINMVYIRNPTLDFDLILGSILIIIY